MRRTWWHLAIAGVALVLMVALIACSGCSAQWWAGENAGRTPGVHLFGPTLFTPAELSVTSDLKAKIKKLEYTGASQSQPSTFTLVGEFGQDVSAVLKEQPAVLAQVAVVQHEQVLYVEATWKGIVGALHEIMPALSAMTAAKAVMTDVGQALLVPQGVTAEQALDALRKAQGILAQLQAAQPEK